ncbi:MAG: hypothetical protein JOY51_00330, partial [Nevskia sp.]|nr:hypothetical protein [Nevskia sp.]
MRLRGGLSRLAVALLPVPLAACSLLGGMAPGGDPIHVLEVRRMAVCNSDGPQAQLTLL